MVSDVQYEKSNLLSLRYIRKTRRIITAAVILLSDLYGRKGDHQHIEQHAGQPPAAGDCVERPREIAQRAYRRFVALAAGVNAAARRVRVMGDAGGRNASQVAAIADPRCPPVVGPEAAVEARHLAQKLERRHLAGRARPQRHQLAEQDRVAAVTGRA